VKQGQHRTAERRPRVLTVVAFVMILFGAVEVVTAFTHHFVGISTSPSLLFTASAAAIGLCYAAAGGLILTMKKGPAALAILLLMADILGRLALVVTGLYPLNSLEQIIGIVGGTAIAAIFAIYVRAQWAVFQ
jgi:hypothetical protein